MHPEIITLGEILVEIMRKDRDVPHDVPGVYLGPYPSGAPAIFIDTVANFGVSSGIIGVVGEDDFGELLLNRLRKDGVDVSRIRVMRGYTTGTTFVMYYSSGERKFIFHLRHSAAGQLSPEDVEEEYVAKSRLLHIMGSSLAVSESSKNACYKATEIARNSNVMITFDPNLRPELLDVETIREICMPMIKLCKVMLPSRGEATALSGVKDPIEAGKKLVNMGPEVVVVKMGDKGAVAITEEEVFFEPPFEVNEVDPTGAGDVYDAAFIYGLLKNWPLSKTMEFASASGAIKVTKFGPMNGPSSIKEVEEFIKKNRKKTLDLNKVRV
ncbi:MAG: sugar kinase [Thermoproteota archaeon]